MKNKLNSDIENIKKMSTFIKANKLALKEYDSLLKFKRENLEISRFEKD